LFIFGSGMRVLILSIIIGWAGFIQGQNGINIFNNSVSTSLNNSNVADPGVKALSLNPAALVQVSKLYISVGAQQSFLISDINQGNFDFAYRIKKNHALGLQLYYNGTKTFNEMKASLGYALQLADQTSLGLRLHGIVVTSPENKKELSATFSLGAQTQLSPQFGVGLVTFNPVGFFRSNESNDLTHSIQFGVGYFPAEYLRLYLSGILDDGHPLSVAGGIAYNINQKVFLYLSARANPGIIGLGIGIPLGKGSSIDLSGTQHLQLGFSPGATYTYSTP